MRCTYITDRRANGTYAMCMRTAHYPTAAGPRCGLHEPKLMKIRKQKRKELIEGSSKK